MKNSCILVGLLFLFAATIGTASGAEQRVQNRFINAFAKEMLDARVLEVRMYGPGMSIKKEGGVWIRKVERNPNRIQEIIRAFSRSSRQSGIVDEPGNVMEEPTYFEFVVQKGNKKESLYLRVIKEELKAHWGPEVTRIFQRYANRAPKGR